MALSPQNVGFDLSDKRLADLCESEIDQRLADFGIGSDRTEISVIFSGVYTREDQGTFFTAGRAIPRGVEEILRSRYCAAGWATFSVSQGLDFYFGSQNLAIAILTRTIP